MTDARERHSPAVRRQGPGILATLKTGGVEGPFGNLAPIGATTLPAVEDLDRGHPAPGPIGRKRASGGRLGRSGVLIQRDIRRHAVSPKLRFHDATGEQFDRGRKSV